MNSSTVKTVTDIFPRKVITPLVGFLALVIGVSGVMLFFHVGDGLVQGTHEWLGMLFALAMIVHLLPNWNAFKRHLSFSAGRRIATAVVLAAAVFVGLGAWGPSHGPGQIIAAVETAPINTVAELFSVDEQRLLDELGKRGFTVTSSEQSLQKMAELSNRGTRESLGALMEAVDRIEQ